MSSKSKPIKLEPYVSPKPPRAIIKYLKRLEKKGIDPATLAPTEAQQLKAQQNIQNLIRITQPNQQGNTLKSWNSSVNIGPYMNAAHQAAVTNAANRGNNFKPWNPSGNMLPYVNPTGTIERFDPTKNYRASITPLTPFGSTTNGSHGGRSTHTNRRKKRSNKHRTKRSKRHHSRRK